MRIRGADVPLFAVVGGAATALAFLATVVLNPDVAAAGTGWLVLGLILYWIYRRGQGLDLDLHAQGRDRATRRRP